MAVVMGTHGQSALEQIFVGSTTRKTIESIQHPVIAVPPLLPTDVNAPKRILWAIDGDTIPKENTKKFLLDLAHKQNGQLTFYYAGDDEAKAEIQAASIAGTAPYNLYTITKHATTSEEILDAVADTSCELLVMNHRERGVLATWFGGSMTAKLLRLTRVPILVLPA